MIQERLITREQLEEALLYQKKVSHLAAGSATNSVKLGLGGKKLIGEALVELGYIREGTLLNFLAGFFHERGTSEIGTKVEIFDDVEELLTSDFKKWLLFMVKKGASDLHIVAGISPRLRIHGSLISINVNPLKAEQIKDMVYSILSYQEIEALEQNRVLDKSFEIENVSRYRLNLHWQRDSIGVSVRALPLKIPTFNELGVPEIMKDFVSRPNGLVLVTGPAGSGKSTTLAAAIEYINNTKAVHIVTIEDPIEYIFTSKKSLIRQREVGKDTLSFKEALKSVVRQDPNVILIGEMRDLDTMQAALTLAETGHLVLSTLHTQDASHAISRIVDVFPRPYQHEVRIQLSLVIQGIVVQQLIPRADKTGRILACEILNCTSSIRNLIRENNLAQIRSFIQIGSQFGMKPMNLSLVELCKEGTISLEDAYLRSNDKEELAQLMLKSH